MKVVAILLLGTVVLSQDPPDKTKGLKNKQILDKCLSETTKQKGFKFNETVGAAGQNFNPEGVCKSPDFCMAKVGNYILFYKADKCLIQTSDGKIITPKDITDNQEKAQVALTKNPYEAINEVKIDAAGFEDRKYEGTPEAMEGCVVLSVKCTEQQVKKQISDIMKNVELPPQVPKNINIEQYIDSKESTSIYHIQIEKATLLIKQIQWEFKPKLKLPQGVPGVPGIDPSQLNGTFKIDFTAYNEGLDVEVPKEVKARLGLK